MIINISGTKLNIVFKGKEIGFGIFEKKILNYLFNVNEEKELAKKYSQWLVYAPDPVKVKTMIDDKIASVSKVNIQQRMQTIPEQIDESNKKESINFMTAETFVVKEKDIVNVNEEKQTFSLDKEGYKEFEKSNEIEMEKEEPIVEPEVEVTPTVEKEEPIVEPEVENKKSKKEDWKKNTKSKK